MNKTALQHSSINRKAFSVSQNFEDPAEKVYWISRSPAQRLQHIEQLRRINYGRKATERLQRVFAVAQREES